MDVTAEVIQEHESLPLLFPALGYNSVAVVRDGSDDAHLVRAVSRLHKVRMRRHANNQTNNQANNNKIVSNTQQPLTWSYTHAQSGVSTKCSGDVHFHAAWPTPP